MVREKYVPFFDQIATISSEHQAKTTASPRADLYNIFLKAGTSKALMM